MLSKNFQLPLSAWANIPPGELFIFPGTKAPTDISEQNIVGSAGIVPIENSYSYHLSKAAPTHETVGGSIKVRSASLHLTQVWLKTWEENSFHAISLHQVLCMTARRSRADTEDSNRSLTQPFSQSQANSPRQWSRSSQEPCARSIGTQRVTNGTFS